MKQLCYLILSVFALGGLSCVQINSHAGYTEKNSVQLYIKNFGAAVRQINADLVADDIDIKGDTQGETYVTVRVSGDGVSATGVSVNELQQRVDKYYDIQIRQQDKTLYISVKQKMNDVPQAEALGFSFEVHTANSSAAAVKNVSGDVKIDRLAGADASTVSGDIELDNISGNATASNTSGNIDGDNIGSVSDAQTVSGDIKLKINSLPADAEISSVSGGIQLSYPSNIQASVDLGALSGDVHIGNAGAVNYSVKKDNKTTAALNDGGKSLSVHTTSGDISIN